MVAYFKRQTWLMMVGGLLAGLLIAAVGLNTFLAGENIVNRLSFVMLMGLLGIVLGRIAAARWSGRKLAALNSLLYDRCDPRAFIDAFGPIAAKVPRDNVAFADARVKLSFAREALGDFDGALAELEDVRPGEMKLHSLHASALLENQKARVQLLREDADGAKAAIDALTEVETQAKARAKMLGEQVTACLKLARVWHAFLTGGEADLEYLEEEANLARNDIYRAEMELLCGRVHEARGEADRAREQYARAAGHGRDLYAGRTATERLQAVKA